MYNPRREDIHPHAKQTPRERNEKIRVLRRREEERVDAPPRGKTPLEPRINHPNNRAVPPADSPKRAPTLRNSVFRACVQGGRFLDCYRDLSPRKIGGEKCDYSLLAPSSREYSFVDARRSSCNESRKTGTP